MILFVYKVNLGEDVMNTTQKMKMETLQRLRQHGKMGDSFDRVMNKLLDQVENPQSN